MDEKTYHCDICGDPKDWDNEIIWITSSFGICDICYDKLNSDELERIRTEHE